MIAAAQQAAKATAPATTLKVGDPAPPISVMKWLKGRPVNLKDGKVHVVEFWATWCEPCKIGMPHLSELAGQYKGRVDFTGVSVREEEQMRDKSADSMPKVQRFVEHAHGMMAYNVAADGPAKTMMKTWMTAAGQHGIPTAFVVDQRGRIAWIGHPLMGLSEVLPLVLDHKLDKAATDRIAAEWQNNLKEGQQIFGDLQKAVTAKDFAKVIDLSDKMVAEMPFEVAFGAPMKYVALVNTDSAKAAKYANDALKEYANSPIVLESFASMIADDSSPITKRDYALALKFLNGAQNCLEPDWSFAETYAEVCSKSGDASSAVKWEASALQSAESAGYPQKMLDDTQKKLDEYKAAAQHQGK